MIGKLYKWIWFYGEFWIKDPKQRRPFTFLIRDFYHHNPLLTIILGGASFYVLGRWGWQSSPSLFITILVVLLCGCTLGHLFWTKWIEGEQENPPYLGQKGS